MFHVKGVNSVVNLLKPSVNFIKLPGREAQLIVKGVKPVVHPLNSTAAGVFYAF